MCCCIGGIGGKGLVLALVAGSVAVGAAMLHQQQARAEKPDAASPSAGDAGAPQGPDYALGFTVNRIDGSTQDLAEFKGRVVMIVNTASKCGLTRQYAELEKLYQSHKDKGLVILGFPANNFGNQEPGTNEDIAEFCSSTYGVTFPMFEKISVKGDDQHPLYKRLAGLPEPLGGDPKWNFTKFITDRSGRVVARFEPRTAPDDPALTARIEELLKAQ